MTTTPFDLGKLLSPLKTQDFFLTYWERQHLLLKREQAGYYDSLIKTADLEAIISDSDMRYPALRLAKGGGYFAPEVYTRNIKHGDESFLGVPDVKRISEEYRHGATIALPAIHRNWRALGVLCEQLQMEFDHPAHANVYITPGNAAGFTPHYDTHEVIVLQIAGKKRWSIYAPVIDLPHRTQLFAPQAYSGQAPIAEVDLQAGDLLYLPRGFLHSTTTSDSFSAHVTLGITVYTWADLLKEYVQTAITDKEHRRALTPGFASRTELKPLLREQLIQALDRLRTTTDIDQLIGSFTDRVRATRLLPPPSFTANVSVVTLDSVLKSPPPESYRVIADEDKRVLEFNGVHYQIPIPVELTIRAMSKLRTFRGSDIAEHLEPEGRLLLIRHLTDIGFLTTAGTA
jgi:ribosomal protein L16 Arg81 hydroxylase